MWINLFRLIAPQSEHPEYMLLECEFILVHGLESNALSFISKRDHSYTSVE